MNGRLEKTSAEQGFTLIEILASVAILAAGISMLIALETRYLTYYEREQQRTRAALYGQYLLAVLEADKEPPEQGSKSGSLEEYLKRVGYFDYESDASRERPEDLQGWRYELQVTSQDFPPQMDVLRRVDLAISWSEEGGDAYHLVYYAHVPQEAGTPALGAPGT